MTKFIKTIWMSVDYFKVYDPVYSELLYKIEELETRNLLNKEYYNMSKTGKVYIKIEVNENHYDEVLKAMKYYEGYKAIKILSSKPNIQ